MSAPTPPHDLDAEQALIGSLLLDREAIISVLPLVDDRDFYRTKHGLIFRAVADLAARREPADLITVTAELDRTGKLDHVGGHAGVGELLALLPTAVHAPYYARIVADLAAKRRLIAFGSDLVRRGYDRDSDLAAVLSDARAGLNGIERPGSHDRLRTFAEALPPFAERMEAMWNGDILPDLVPTKLVDLDRALGGGFQRGHLVIVAARPSMGKTAFAVDIAKKSAEYYLATMREPHWTLIFSAEMTLDGLLWRAVAETTGIPAAQLQHGHGLTQTQKERIMEQIAWMMTLPIAIDDSSQPSTRWMRAKLERFMADRPVRTVLFDYLEQAGNDDADEVKRVSKIAADLKSIAKDTDTTMIALSQLNRAVESRKETAFVPTMADLRWSGRIEQEADLILMLYRQDYYAHKGMLTAEHVKPEKVGTCDVIIAKQRDGITPTIPVAFVPELTAFRNLDRRTA